MLPRVTNIDTVDCMPSHRKHGSNFHSSVSLAKHFYLSCYARVNLCFKPSLFGSIHRIVLFSSKKQMKWINTITNIARMAYAYFWRNSTTGKRIGYSVSQSPLTTSLQVIFSIAALSLFHPEPQPAIIQTGDFDMGPKPFFVRRVFSPISIASHFSSFRIRFHGDIMTKGVPPC